MGTEKGLPLQQGQQAGRLAVELERAAVLPGKNYMTRLLLQIEQLREREP